MSWQQYIDVSLVGSGHIDKGAIISPTCDSQWVSSPGFTVRPEEMGVLPKIFQKDTAAVGKAYGEGLYINGERFVLVNRIYSTDDTVDENGGKVPAQNRSIYLRQGRTGVCIVNATHAVIIGHYGEGQIAGNATQCVESLADYLQKAMGGA